MSGFINTAVPDKEFRKNVLLEHIGSRSFCFLYNFESKTTEIYIPGGDSYAIIRDIESSIPGLSFAELPKHREEKTRSTTLMSFYKRMEEHEVKELDDIFGIDISTGKLCVIVVPEPYEKAAASKRYMDRVLSDTTVRESLTIPGMRHTGGSLQRDLFTDSEETVMLRELVDQANASILSNGTLYKAFIAVIDAPRKLLEYIESKLLVLTPRKVVFREIDDLIEKAGRYDSLPLGRDYVARFLNFCGAHSVNYTLNTLVTKSSGDIGIGVALTDAVQESGIQIGIEKSTLNLGMVISGLPGSGKTHLAMHIIDALLDGRGNRPKVAVISQTDEWNSFAESHGMHLIRLCDGKVPINLFRCPRGIDAIRFGEDLATVLSAASDAGPYKKPMEKCLVNAFTKIYAEGNIEPDPALVYQEVQESIIGLHGKRTHAGVKYTKHGENIKSSLEHLANILRLPEYSVAEGVRIEELLDEGAVFDLSLASMKTKAYFYALLLNQIYAAAAKFDSGGDDELRMLICVEEAQLVFGEDESAAVEDLAYRLQEFRKRGIGLVLIVHNVVDIDPRIRRLCQVKTYFKQAADVAPLAARDLVFSAADEDDVILKLKHLDSRVAALSFVIKTGKEKSSPDTMFIKTGFYAGYRGGEARLINQYMDRIGVCVPDIIEAAITIEVGGECEAMKHPPVAIRVSFIDSLVATLELGTIGGSICSGQRLVSGRLYRFDSIDEDGRITGTVTARSKAQMHLRVGKKLECIE